jgi:enamine deaminase RidA (YjgF/YER057c/UK114 family)
VYIAGFDHENPIPVASRKGPFVFSGVLTGRDPETRLLSGGLEEQIATVFVHVGELMAAVGGTLDDVIKMTFWLADPADRAALNREWLSTFPEASSRPARQVMHAVLAEGMLVQADLVAIVTEGEPTSI